MLAGEWMEVFEFRVLKHKCSRPLFDDAPSTLSGASISETLLVTQLGIRITSTAMLMLALVEGLKVFEF